MWCGDLSSYVNYMIISPLGLQVEAERFFIYWLIVMMVNIAAVSLAFFISAGVRNVEIANALMTLPIVISLVSLSTTKCMCIIIVKMLVSKALCRIADISRFPPCVAVMGPVHQLYEVWS